MRMLTTWFSQGKRGGGEIDRRGSHGEALKAFWILGSGIMTPRQNDLRYQHS